MGGFNRADSNDNYVLLGGGGHKAISDFAGASHSHNYLPLSGGTISGNLTVTGDSIFKQSAYIFNGYDLILRAESGSSDPGDIIFQNGSNTEIGRIYYDNYYGGQFLARFSSSDSPKVLIHSGNISNYVSGAALNKGGINSSIDNLTESGFYCVWDGGTGRPNNSWGGYLIVMNPNNDTDFVCQIYICGMYNYMYSRKRWGSTDWSTWRKYLDT